MKTLLLILALALLTGCSTGRFKTSGGTKLTAPKDAASPSFAKEGQRVVKAELGAGSVVVREKIEATPQSPAIERETTTYSAATEKVETETRREISVAPPRPPDQQVALRNADNKARQPILFTSLAFVVLGGFLLYRGKLELAIVSGSVAGALALLWYSLGNPYFMAAAFVLVALGVGYFIWIKHKKAMTTEEVLRRMIQTGEELKIDKPDSAQDMREYNDANMDQSHKEIVQEIKSTISEKYIREQLAKRPAATK